MIRFHFAIICISACCLHSASAQLSTVVSEPRQTTQPSKCAPGPWGELEYYPLHLEAPDHISDLISSPSERTSWHFPGKTLEEIDAILTAALIGETDRQRIYSDSNVDLVDPPYRLYPAADIVESMNSLSRQSLYRHLSPWSENRFHRHPFIIESGNVRSWFANSELSLETILHVEKLTYKLGNSLAFSDVPAVLTRINSDKEEREFLRAITRTRSLMLRMTVSPESDFPALKKYWTLGRKGKDLMSFFDSISQTTDVEKVDAIHFLPPTPRKYLNTFPSLSLGMEGQYPGHFWTSLNFGRFNPLQDFDNDEYATMYIHKFLHPVEKPYQFGDLVLFFHPVTHKIIHTCIFVADDIVYTKNGRSPFNPFMLMKLEDLMGRLSIIHAEPGVEVRRKIE
ncbi:MAG: hypothetical protein MI807_23360 [Verrucomicrobiales bacterium]|nr:hypothetical protein [Verrucomicrobiales bacterium]